MPVRNHHYMTAGIGKAVKDHEILLPAIEHQRGGIVGCLRGRTKNALSRGAGSLYILIAPRGPEVVHAVFGRIRLRVWYLFGRGRRRWCAGQGHGRIIHHVLQFLTGFEIRNFLSWHFYPSTGFWIAADSRLALPRTKATKATDFNFVAGPQRTND